MAFDPLTAEQSFPFVQAFFGGLFLWLGLNIRIVRIDTKDKRNGL